MSHATVLKEWPDYYASIECTLNMFLFSGCSVLHWYQFCAFLNAHNLISSYFNISYCNNVSPFNPH